MKFHHITTTQYEMPQHPAQHLMEFPFPNAHAHSKCRCITRKIPEQTKYCSGYGLNFLNFSTVIVTKVFFHKQPRKKFMKFDFCCLIFSESK